MSRASKTLGPFVLAVVCALGCKPSAPPPSPTTPSAPPPAASHKWSPGSGELRDADIPPTVAACAAGELDEATVKAVVQRLATTGDRRGEPCFLKALKDYKAGADDDAIGAAAKAVAAMELKSASGPLLDAFKGFHASQAKSRSTPQAIRGAMVLLRDKAWADDLIAMLDKPIDRKAVESLTDEIFWQSTAAECLGLLKSEKAVRPLIKVTLSPQKAAAHPSAVLALVEIGKPAIAPTVAVLRGQDQELLVYSMTENVRATDASTRPDVAPEAWHFGAASQILATMGRPETTAPLLEAMNKFNLSKSEGMQSRATIALQLTKVPRTPEVIKAFQDTFTRLPAGLSLPGTSLSAREALLEAAPMFFDASLVPWIVKTTTKLRSDANDIALVRKAALLAALTLALPDQMKTVDALYNHPATIEGKKTTVGKDLEAEYKLTKELLESCSANADCYINRLDDPAGQDEASQFTGIKSAHMIGVLGSAALKPKLLDAIPKIMNSTTRELAAQLVDYFSPKGDAEAADALQKLIDEAEAARDQNAILLNAPLRTVISRLHARIP